MKHLIAQLQLHLTNANIPEWLIIPLSLVIIVIVIVVVSVLLEKIVKTIVLSGFKKVAQKTENKWDDLLLDHKVVSKTLNLIPLIIVHTVTPIVIQDKIVQVVIQKAAFIGMAFVTVSIITALINFCFAIFSQMPTLKFKPLNSYSQLLKLLTYLIAIIVATSILLGKSPMVFLSGLGALTAVLLLVFKDTILGFVASLQIAANDMVRVGDWIEMPSHSADGDVIQVNLNTIKVQNWDKTITTIPTYAIVSESFKNWRGMQDSPGRRIKRSLVIDVNSIKKCTPAMLKNLKKIHLITDHIDKKQREIDNFNKAHNIDTKLIANGRNLTNIGLFRTYIENYLSTQDIISKDLTFLVRQLPPSPNGLPIEIYVFSKQQNWVQYEAIQSDIFDHLLSVVNEFGLILFQHPSGNDILSISKQK